MSFSSKDMRSLEHDALCTNEDLEARDLAIHVESLLASLEKLKIHHHRSDPYADLPQPNHVVGATWIQAFARGAKITASARSPLLKIEGSQHEQASPNSRGLLVLALLLKPEEREAIVGDTEERYRVALTKWGQKRANILFWSDIGRSAIALIARAIRIPVLFALAEQLIAKVHRFF